MASDAPSWQGLSPDVYKWGNIEVRVFDEDISDWEYRKRS